MNKQKLTLLIALSTTIAIILGYFLCPVVASTSGDNIQTKITETAMTEDPDPVVAIATEEEIEEPVVEERATPPVQEEVIVEEPAAADPVVETPPVVVPQGEFAVARQVWDIMKSYGWSDEICAGIMGNMMRECGGDTLNLNPYAQNSHYGLCQWSSRYHYGAWNKDIVGQLEYLKGTLNLAIFDGCSTPEQVAETFCWNYERPSRRDPVHKRIANARVAYEYFVG